MEEQDSRSYLASKVHPVFEKLLIELLIIKPDDPVEFMSQWLLTTGQQYRPQEKSNAPFSSSIPAQFQNSMQSGTQRKSQVQSLQNPIIKQQSNQPGSNNHIPHLQSNQQLSNQHSSQPVNSQIEINSQQLIQQNLSKQGIEQSDFQQRSFEDFQHKGEHHFDLDPHFGSGEQLSPSPIVADPKKSVHPFQKQQSVLTQNFQPSGNNNKQFKKSQTQQNPNFLQPVTNTTKPLIILNNTSHEQNMNQMKQSQGNVSQQSQQKLKQQHDDQEIQMNKRNSLTESKEQLVKQQQQQQQQQSLKQVHYEKLQESILLQNNSSIMHSNNFKFILKNKDQKSRLLKIINNCHIFKHLNDQQKEIVINAMEEKTFKCNDIIIKQDEEGDQLYLVDQGLLDCLKKGRQDHEEKLIKFYQSGDFFGEMALLNNQKRAASIIAKADSVLWLLDKEIFDAFIKNQVLENRQKYDEILQNFQILSQLDPYIRLLIADALNVFIFKSQQTVFKQKDKGDYFYLIQEGQLRAFKQSEDDGNKQLVLYEFDRFDYFGELAMLKEITREATIVCESDCILLGLDKQSFKKLLAPIHELLRQGTERYQNCSFN